MAISEVSQMKDYIRNQVKGNKTFNTNFGKKLRYFIQKLDSLVMNAIESKGIEKKKKKAGKKTKKNEETEEETKLSISTEYPYDKSKIYQVIVITLHDMGADYLSFDSIEILQRIIDHKVFEDCYTPESALIFFFQQYYSDKGFESTGYFYFPIILNNINSISYE